MRAFSIVFLSLIVFSLTSAALAVPAPKPPILCLSTSGKILVRSKCKSSETRINAGNLVTAFGSGPKGEKGDRGDKGDIGPAGPQGPKGDTGEYGSVAVYGDGSAGDFNVSNDQTLKSRYTQFDNVTIDSGVTLTVSSGTIIRCKGAFTNNGTIVVGTGAVGGTMTSISNDATKVNIPMVQLPGLGLAANLASSGGVGTRHGLAGYGGRGFKLGYAPLVVKPGLFGGGAGAGMVEHVGGGGGGFFAIYAQAEITIGSTGVIAADGGKGDFGSGGGGGGVVVLASKTSVVNLGTISVKGGNGGDGESWGAGAGGGGGGGLINALAPSVSIGGTEVAGGTAGTPEYQTIDPGQTVLLFGGGGGGACYGDGGKGGEYTQATSADGEAGGDGVTITSSVDPTSLLL